MKFYTLARIARELRTTHTDHARGRDVLNQGKEINAINFEML